MNYAMVKREAQTLGEDLRQLAEDLIGPEPEPVEPGLPVPGQMVKAKQQVVAELVYIQKKLDALYHFVADCER